MKQRTEQKLGAKFTEFEAVKYKTQIVTETSYFFKLKVG